MSISAAKDRLLRRARSAPAMSPSAPRRLQRDQYTAEADEDRAPAPPADEFAEKDRGARGDEDRTGQIIGDDIRQRQIGRRPEERRDFQCRQHHANELQTRPIELQEVRTIPPDPTAPAAPAPQAAAASIARPNRCRRRGICRSHRHQENMLMPGSIRPIPASRAARLSGCGRGRKHAYVSL